MPFGVWLAMALACDDQIERTEKANAEMEARGRG